jgi:predicted MFS family arabinose efflux permease
MFNKMPPTIIIAPCIPYLSINCLYIVSFAFVGNVSMFVILPPHMLHEHFTKQDVIIVLIVVGGVKLIARFVAGKLLDLGYFTVQTLFVVNVYWWNMFNNISVLPSHGD